MKLVFWAVVVPLLLIAALFAFSNRGEVTVEFVVARFEAPLFAVVVGALYCGFAFGGLAAWWSGRVARRRARREGRRADEFERELARAKGQPAGGESAPAPAGTPGLPTRVG